MQKSQRIFKLAPLPILSFFLILLSAANLTATPTSFADIFDSEKEKIVHISTSSLVSQQKTFRDLFFEQYFKDIPQKRRKSALGSGFIISKDGYIVTNNHVIDGAEEIEVTLFNGKKFEAKLVGRDQQTDLALIKIKGKKLPFIQFGDSDNIRIGDWVVALGNPLGLDHSLTAGILSAKGRDIFSGTAYGKFLQTDAAINPGNSGGPLFNMDGKVIGINTAIVAGGQGLGFAIPSNLALKVIQQLKTDGKVIRGWLGVGIQTVSHELAEAFGLPKNRKGVALTAVGKGTPAEIGGLKQGDVIVEYNGTKISKTTELQQQVAETKPGTRTKVKVFRNGKFRSFSITVGKKPEKAQASIDSETNDFGFVLVEITPESKRSLGIRESYGLVVYEIEQGGIAWDKGIRKGDILLEANQIQLNTLNDFQLQISKGKKQNKPIQVLVKRGRNLIFIALPVK